jgi:hypothetical protein
MKILPISESWGFQSLIMSALIRLLILLVRVLTISQAPGSGRELRLPPASLPNPCCARVQLACEVCPGATDKAASILSYLQKSVQEKARGALHEIWMAATRRSAELAIDALRLL